MSGDTIESVIAQCIRPDVQAMRGYAVQPSAGMVKLDAMENPFVLPPGLRVALGDRLAEVEINRYPGSRTDDLKAALARHVSLPAGCELILGNGSDELITLLAIACHLPGAKILAPEPGFVMYEMSAQLQGLGYVGVPLTADFELDEAAMLAAIAEHKPVLTYIAYPNNPTANLFDDAVIEKIVRASPGLVILDEAYQPFASRSWIGRVTQYPNLLIMRTLSKFGLAGIRLGYMLGAKALIDQIDKVRPPYNVGVLHTEAALFALEHQAEFARQAAVLREERTRLIAALAPMRGFKPYDSEANMILVRVPDSTALFEALKACKVLVKNMTRAHPLLTNCLRLTVGTPEENTVMIQALNQANQARQP